MGCRDPLLKLSLTMRANCQLKALEGVLLNMLLNVFFLFEAISIVGAEWGFMLKSAGDTPAPGFIAPATNLST